MNAPASAAYSDQEGHDMPKCIIIPLYDHTTDEDTREALAEIERLGFSRRAYAVTVDKLPLDAELRQIADELGIDLNL